MGKYILIGLSALILLAILALIAFGFLSRRGEEKKAENPLLATVGDFKIYKSNVENAARANYLPSAITNDVLKQYLEILIERAILDIEASKLGLTVSQEEIDSSIYKKQATASGVTKSLDEFVKYKILKDKIMSKQVKSVEAYTIGFWIPPLSAPQESEYQIQRIEGKQALNEILERLQKNEEPVLMVEEISKKYKSIEKIIGINGYNYKLTKDPQVFSKPRTYINDQQQAISSNNMALYELLFQLEKGEARLLEGPNGSGGYVIKVISVQKEGFENFSQFMSAKKKELWKEVNPI